MRFRKAFLSVALVAAAMLLVGTGVMAGTNTPTPAPSPPTTSCTTSNGYTVDVTSGPSVITCPVTLTNPSGQCTEIEYTVSALPDHVAAVEGVGVQYASGNNIQWYDPGAGDPVTGLGDWSFHEQAVKFNPTGSSLSFTVGLAGARQPSPTSVVTKKGRSIGGCTIIGIGLETADNPLATVTPETHEVLGGKCKVKVTKKNGVIDVTYDGETLVEAGCKEIQGPFSPAEVNVTINTPDGPFDGAVEFSEGFNFIVGPHSCTYKQYYPTKGPIYKICY